MGFVIFEPTQTLNTMKQLLLILSIALLTVGSALSQNRYSQDEVILDKGKSMLKSDGTPVNGIVYSEYENGQLRFETNFKDGEKHGLQRNWHVNGQLEAETNFKDGKQDGMQKVWHENGQLKSETNYKDGKEDGLVREWYENGQVLYEKKYNDGKL